MILFHCSYVFNEKTVHDTVLELKIWLTDIVSLRKYPE